MIVYTKKIVKIHESTKNEVAYDGLQNGYIYVQNEESYTLSIYKVRTFLLEH
jgi:hypothetical protein